MKKGNIVRTLCETEKQGDNQKVHEQFMKLKSMECPCCGDVMQLKAGVWRCKRCAYCITQKSMLNGAIFWFCDECGKFMNVQPDFTTSTGTWKCLSCGFMNDVSENNIDDFEEDTAVNEKSKVVIPAKIIENIGGVIQKSRGHLRRRKGRRIKCRGKCKRCSCRATRHQPRWQNRH